MILRGSLFSSTLEMETGLSVLVPNSSLARGPHKLAYLLHGLCGRSGDWIDYTMLPVFAEQHGIAFVMPEVARSFYSDMAFGQRFFSYVSRELPEICRNVFNLSARREDTLVLGASMGGYGALKCALSRPENYGFCAAFSSPCLFLKEGLENQRKYGTTEEFEKRYGRQLLNDFEAIFGTGLGWRAEDEILELAKGVSVQAIKPRLFLASGTEDPLNHDNRRFRDELEKLDLDFRYQEWEGGHDWPFFNAALERALNQYRMAG